ncbi:hypothetical protein JCM8208_001861 [Rhodotorula glutinis]
MDTLRLTGSYIIAPARLANSAVWYALGYSTTADSSDVPPPTSDSAAAAPDQPQGRALAHPGDAGPADDERVVRALRAAMREWDDESVQSSSGGEEQVEKVDEGGEDDPQVDERASDLEPAHSALTRADVSLPDSPTSSSSFRDADDPVPHSPTCPPRPASPPAHMPLARPLSSLSRLSRRATLCLSRLVDLDHLDLDLDPSRAAAEEGGEPSEREKELVERIMADEVERAFERVDLGNGAVETDAFLRAAESLVSLTELLAPAAASLCAGEFSADVGLVQSERRERRRPATDALEWLVLIIGFMAESFRLNLNSQPLEELSTSISTVWDRSYAKHFNWLVRPLFKVIIRACPSREHVYSNLALSPSATLADVERNLGTWLDRVEEVVARVQEVLDRERRRR